MTVQEHADAMLALARGPGPGSPLTVHDGALPKGAVPPYVLVYFTDNDPEEPDSRPLSGRPQRYVLRGIFHLVGENAAATRALGSKLRARLLNVVPAVAGRRCFPIRREDSLPPQRDESTGSLVMDRVDVYRLESEPA